MPLRRPSCRANGRCRTTGTCSSRLTFPSTSPTALSSRGGATFLSLLIGGLAYSLSRFRFFRIAAFSNAALICYMLPEVLVLPLYIYVVKLGLADTLFALIVARIPPSMPTSRCWFMRSYFNAIPVSLEESAMIDGYAPASHVSRHSASGSGVISVGVFSFNHAWNEFLFALVFTSSERNRLPLGLATWIGQDNIYSWGMLLAGAVLVDPSSSTCLFNASSSSGSPRRRG